MKMNPYLILTTLIMALSAPASALAAKAKKAKAPATTPTESTARPVYETNGAFGFCLTDQNYPDGRKLTIAYSQQKQINVGVSIPKGGFKIGSRYDLGMAIDDEDPRKVRASALDEETLLLQMGSNPIFRKKLAAGKTLQVGASGKIVSFELPAMAPRLKDLESCIADYQNSSSPSVAKAEGAMPETLKALLMTAGLTNIVPLNIDDVPEDQRPADFMWQTDNGIMSGVRERMAPDDKNLQELAGLHIQGLRLHCKGRFNAEIGREKTSDGLRLRTADATCGSEDKTSGREIAVSMVIYLSKANVFTVFSFEVPSNRRSEAQAARDKLAKTLLSIAARE